MLSGSILGQLGAGFQKILVVRSLCSLLKSFVTRLNFQAGFRSAFWSIFDYLKNGHLFWKIGQPKNNYSDFHKANQLDLIKLDFLDPFSAILLSILSNRSFLTQIKHPYFSAIKIPHSFYSNLLKANTRLNLQLTPLYIILLPLSNPNPLNLLNSNLLSVTPLKSTTHIPLKFL